MKDSQNKKYYMGVQEEGTGWRKNLSKFG